MEISKYDLETVIKLLFPGEEITEEGRSMLYEYIQTAHDNRNSVALFVTESDKNKPFPWWNDSFWQICQKLRLDPGKREVVITENGAIWYSPDYSLPLREY